MATQTFNLPEFKKGWFLQWGIFIQAANTWTVTLWDDSHTYINGVSASGTNFVKLSQGSATIQGNNLKIKIDVGSDTQKFISPVQGIISDPGGHTKGYLWSIVGEDANDDDYNDILVQMTSWISAG